MDRTLTQAEERDLEGMARQDLHVYWQSRQEGSSHRFALMCALQQAPASRTDSDYFRTHKPIDKQFQGKQGMDDLGMRLFMAKQAGYNVNPHSHYDPSLASYAGDPDGWIGPTDGRGKVEQVMLKRRIAAEKKAEKKAKQKDGRKLAPDIAARFAREAIAKNPELARKSKGELYSMMVAKHGHGKG